MVLGRLAGGARVVFEAPAVSISPREVEGYLLRKQIRKLSAQEAAQQVHEELTACLALGNPPSVRREVVESARQAEPFGDFPDHLTLMMAYEDLL